MAGLKGKIILSNLFRNRSRTFLTVFALSIMMAGAVVLLSINDSMRELTESKYSKKYLETIIVLPEQGKNFSAADFEKIGSTAGVDGYVVFSPFLVKEGDRTLGASFFYISDTSLLGSWLNINFTATPSEGEVFVRKGAGFGPGSIHIRNFSSFENLYPAVFGRKETMVGCIYVSEAGGFVFEPVAGIFDLMRIMETASIAEIGDEGAEFIVGGQFSPEATSIPYLSQLDMIFFQKAGAANMVVVKTTIGRIEGVKRELARQYQYGRVISFYDEYIDVSRRMGGISGMFLVFSLVLIGVTMLSVSSVSAVSVLERKKEIGLMQAFGFLDGRIRKILITENLAFSGLSVLFGIAMSFVFIGLLNALLYGLLKIGFAVSASSNALLLLSALIIVSSAASSMLMLQRVLRQDLTRALK